MKAILFITCVCFSVLAQCQDIRAVKTWDEKASKFGMKVFGKNRWFIPAVYDEILTPQVYNSKLGRTRIIVKKDGKYGLGWLGADDEIDVVYNRIEAADSSYRDVLFCQLTDGKWDVWDYEKVATVKEVELILNAADSSKNSFLRTEKIYRLERAHGYSFYMVSGNTHLDTLNYESLRVTSDGNLLAKQGNRYRLFSGSSLSSRYRYATGNRYTEYTEVVFNRFGMVGQRLLDKKWEFIDGTGPKNQPSAFENAFTLNDEIYLLNGLDTFKVKYLSPGRYDLESSSRFAKETLTKLDHNRWIVKTHTNKYGIYDGDSRTMVMDTVHTLIYPWEYSPVIVIVKKPGKAYLYGTFHNTTIENVALVDIEQLRSYNDEAPLFGKTTHGKWLNFSPSEFMFDTTVLHDEIKDGRSPNIYFTRNANTWTAYLKDRGKFGIQLALQRDEEPSNFLFGRSLLVFRKSGEWKYGLKMANGKTLIHPACDDISLTANEIVFTIDGIKTTMQLDVRKSVQLDPDNLITLHPDECVYCSFGSVSVKKVKPDQTKTITQGTSVQSLQSEKFDAKTGTWTKTYSYTSGNKRITTSHGSSSTELVDCSICKGTGKSAGVFKWDGKKYVLTKRN